MKKNDKIIYTLIATIIISSILLFVAEQHTPYDENIYDQAYKEYNKITEIASSNVQQSTMDNQQNTHNSTDNAVIEQNNFTNQNIVTYAPISKPTPTYSTIGIINIPKINISYPILKDYKDEYLNIAPLRLAGPEINKSGNLVVVAHNNLNQELFSNLHKLSKDDIVKLTDTAGKSLTYRVYSKYEVSENDLSVLNQNTNGQIELTLITCVKYNFSKRLVVKCIAI